MKNNILIAIILTFLLTSCGSKNVIHEGTAEDLYQEALRELDREGGFPWIFTGTNYDKLFEILKEIQIRHTFSQYAPLAELRTADAYFKKEEYKLAATEYINFINTHVVNPELEHAVYQLANSHYKLRKGKDRDPQQPTLAVKWFTKFIEEYPNSKLVEEAERKIAKCKNILAEREIYIGNFYKRRNNYKAAINRYKNVLEQYPDTKYKDEAIKLIKKTEGKVSES